MRTLARLSSITVVLAMLVAGCAPASPTAAPTAQPIKLTVARTSGPASALLFIADDQGFLKANGLDAEVRNYPSSADATNALVAGEERRAESVRPEGKEGRGRGRIGQRVPDDVLFADRQAVRD